MFWQGEARKPTILLNISVFRRSLSVANLVPLFHGRDVKLYDRKSTKMSFETLKEPFRYFFRFVQLIQSGPTIRSDDKQLISFYDSIDTDLEGMHNTTKPPCIRELILDEFEEVGDWPQRKFEELFSLLR